MGRRSNLASIWIATLHFIPLAMTCQKSPVKNPLDMKNSVCYIVFIYGNQRTSNENITRTFPSVKR